MYIFGVGTVCIVLVGSSVRLDRMVVFLSPLKHTRNKHTTRGIAVLNVSTIHTGYCCYGAKKNSVEGPRGSISFKQVSALVCCRASG